MAKIKHLAIRTTDIEKTVAFYKEVFDLKQVGLGIRGVYLSDGHINLAILKPNRRNKDGIFLDTNPFYFFKTQGKIH